MNSFDEDTPLYQELLTFVGLFVFIYVAFFFHIIIHEAGHLVFGLLTGYKFSSFRVASFMWLKEDGKLKLKRLSIAGTGGQCLMTPPDMKDGKMPLVLYNLGGSFLNITLGALFLIGYLLCSDIPFFSSLLLSDSTGPWHDWSAPYENRYTPHPQENPWNPAPPADER